MFVHERSICTQLIVHVVSVLRTSDYRRPTFSIHYIIIIYNVAKLVESLFADDDGRRLMNCRSSES